MVLWGNIEVVPPGRRALHGPATCAVSPEAVLLYLDTLEAAGRSPHTISGYRKRLLPFIQRLDGRLPEPIDVRDYLDTFKSINNRSVTLVVMRQWFKFLRKRGLVDGDPSEGIPIPKQKRRNYPPISAEEFSRLVIHLSTDALRVLAHIFFRVGSRLAEALAIRTDDVAFEEDGYGTISFPRRKGEVDGFASFGPDLGVILRPYLVGRGGHLFDFRNQTIVDYYFRIAGVKAGIPGVVTPHRLRHSFIIASVDAGWQQLSLQKQLGHSSPLSTAWYFQATRRGLVEAYRRAYGRKDTP